MEGNDRDFRQPRIDICCLNEFDNLYHAARKIASGPISATLSRVFALLGALSTKTNGVKIHIDIFGFVTSSGT